MVRPHDLCGPPGHNLRWYSTHGMHRAGDQTDDPVLFQGRNAPTPSIPSYTAETGLTTRSGDVGLEPIQHVARLLCVV